MAFIHNLLLILERGIGEVMFQNNANWNISKLMANGNTSSLR